MKREIAAIIACLLISPLSFAITLHVPSQYPTIQAGINAAVDGDTVLVAGGGYNEHIDFLGKEIVVKSESGAELTAIVWAGQENVVTMNSGEQAVLEGFTIQNDHPGDMAGCGVYCGPGSWPVIRRNRIIECGSIWCQPGGGISASSASPHIEDNLISGNMCAYYGAGIYLSHCFDVVIRYNIITNNYTASGYGVAIGGGLYADSCEGLIERNLFVSNVADPDYGYGGGIAVTGSGWCQIWRNTFSENVSGMNNCPTGGGICLGYPWGCTASISFEDNILVNSPQGGGFSLYGGTPILTLDFNDIWNNQPFNYYGCTAGPFDISADPLFVGGSPYSYELTAGSPCIDAGSFMAIPDPDGTRADMGAYPFDRVGMNVTFQPYFWPINIPANGGWFAGHFFLTNNTSAPSSFDFWVDVLLPDSSVFGPVILRRNLTFSPGQQIMRAVVQNVPGGAPEGNYLYRAHTGIYRTGQLYCEMAMPFTKLGAEGSDARWAIQGDLDDWGNAIEMAVALPEAMQLEVSPNPFNPNTTLSFSLPISGRVTLIIYDLCGRNVATLLDREMTAGYQEVRFDGNNLASGIYWAVLEAGGMKSVQKLMLVK